MDSNAYYFNTSNLESINSFLFGCLLKDIFYNQHVSLS